MKLVAGIEYVGTAYSGWQFQKHSASIQQNVDSAFSQIANETITSVCSGRTDSGVHAKEQIIHIETTATRTDYAWRMGCNSVLPEDIRVLWCHQVDDSFHARFSAISRSYRYVIYNTQSDTALLKNRVNWIPYELDVQKMNLAAQDCLGEHDFTSFRASGCQANTPFRKVQRISVERHADFIVIEVTANAFLHHMVRNLVGSLIEVGRARQPVDWMKTLLQAKDRRQAGVTAYAGGLYFVSVLYDGKFNLQQRKVTQDLLF